MVLSSISVENVTPPQQRFRRFKKHEVNPRLFIYVSILLLGEIARQIKFITHILCPALLANVASLNQNAEAWQHTWFILRRLTLSALPLRVSPLQGWLHRILISWKLIQVAALPLSWTQHLTCPFDAVTHSVGLPVTSDWKKKKNTLTHHRTESHRVIASSGDFISCFPFRGEGVGETAGTPGNTRGRFKSHQNPEQWDVGLKTAVQFPSITTGIVGAKQATTAPRYADGWICHRHGSFSAN